MKRRRRPSLLKRLLYTALLMTFVFLAFSAPFFSTGTYGVNPHARLKKNKSYTVSVWIAYPPLPNEGNFLERLHAEIAGLSLPANLKLDVRLLPEQEATQELVALLDKGRPPDLYLDIGSGQSYYGNLQIPIGLYTTLPNLPAGVISQAYHDDILFGYPVVGIATVMLGNRSLLDSMGLKYEVLAQSGWRWADFFSAIESHTLGKKFGFALTNPGEPLLRVLATSLGKPAPYNKDGGLLWSTDDLFAMAQNWERIRSSPGVPPGDRLMSDSLMLFLQQSCAIVGPVNPILMDWIWTESLARGIEPVVMPIPSDIDGAAGNIHVSSLVMFRQKPYKGHDHSTAAAHMVAELAPVLSTFISEFYKAVPLLQYAGETMRAESLDRTISSMLERAVNVAREPGPAPRSMEAIWEADILPAWLSLTSGQITAEEFAQQTYARLQR